MKKAVLISLAFLSQTSSVYAQELVHNIVSYYGNRKPDSDARPIEKERRIIDTVVDDSYDYLPSDLQIVSLQVTYYIDHAWEIVTKNYLGFAAEDDDTYIYPDKTYYNSRNNPKGTIKLNLTEKFVQACDFLINLIQENPNDPTLQEAARTFYRSVISHELLHAWQYHTKPVLDLERNVKRIGTADTNGHIITFEDLVAGQRQKVEYERKAYELTISYFKPGQLELLAEKTKAIMAQYPEQFEPGAKYALLNDSRKNPFVSRYMLEMGTDVKQYASTHTPGPSWIMSYEGQIRPVEIYLEMQKTADNADLSFLDKKSEIKKLNDELQTYETNDFWKSITAKSDEYLLKYTELADKIANRYLKNNGAEY